MKKGARKSAKRPDPVASFDWSPMHITVHPHGDMPFMFHIPRGSWELIKADAKASGLGVARYIARDFAGGARCAYENILGDKSPDALHDALSAQESGKFGVVRLVFESAGPEGRTP